MKNIFLVPRVKETSHKGHSSTLEVGEPYSSIEPFLSEKEKTILSKYPKLRIWATKCGPSGASRTKWSRMNPGDYVLFYANFGFYYSATVILTKFSDELAMKLWPQKNGKPWSGLFFLEDLREVNIPMKTIQELGGHDIGWTYVQGFTRMNDESLESIKDKFGTIESFLNQDFKTYELISNISETMEEERLEDKVEEISRENLAKAFNFSNTGDSHKTITDPKKTRIENQAQKKRIALIEGYACQICNWSLIWENHDGKKSYRIDVDHITDKAKGGGEEASNLWVLCPNCHAKKTLGVIFIDKKKKIIKENGVEIKLHHDKHLNWL